MNAKECSKLIPRKPSTDTCHFLLAVQNNNNYYLIEPQSAAWANKLKSVHKAVYAVPVACVFNQIIINNGI